MKGQPKGLIAAALANMGERFGFYIMMAILTLFISAKFGLNETTAGYIYSGFYASIYLLALVGGIIADKTRNYKGTIMWGLVVMSLGYLIIAIPTPTPVSSLPLYLTLTCVGLLVIAFGNGLFKGNLQALVGQMYDNKEFSAKRESGFQIFYMFINIGGFFAPFVAIGVRNWWLKVNNFDYNAKLPELCHEYLAKGEHMAGEGLANLTSYANSAYLDGTPVSAAGLHDFCNGYLDVFNRGFHYAFIAAIVMMLVSLVIYLSNKRRFPDPSKKAAAGGVKASAEEITMSAQEIRQRIYALFAVFGVVIFFWVSFHQNGYSLTYFARDYVNLDVININLGFTTIKGAEIFQSVNPFFVVTLTPLIMWFFGWLRKRNIEVSTPMKIAIGMGIAKINALTTEDDSVLVTIITDGEENCSEEYDLKMIKNLIEKLKKQNWTFTFIGTDDLDVENIAHGMGIDNHLQFSEDEAGTKAMFARENRARERYNKCRAMDCKMEAGSYFEEK